jgi:hypothetical protein
MLDDGGQTQNRTGDTRIFSPLIYLTTPKNRENGLILLRMALRHAQVAG